MTKKIINTYNEIKLNTENSNFEGKQTLRYNAMIGSTNRGLNNDLKSLASTLNNFSKEGEDIAIINGIHQDMGDIEFTYGQKYFNMPLNDQEIKDLTKHLGFNL